jgi:hypothetical protein
MVKKCLTESEPTWFQGKTSEFKQVAIALLSSGFLYCGKLEEFYDKDEINKFEKAKVGNWYIFISPDENIDIYSEGELLTLPNYQNVSQEMGRIHNIIENALKDSHILSN